MNSNFYIHHDKFQELSDESIDWFIKSLKFPYKSDEWTICHLKQKIFMRQALKHLKECRKYLYETL